MGTHRHIHAPWAHTTRKLPPQLGTYMHTHSQLCTVSPPPPDVPPQAVRGCKREQEASPRWSPGGDGSRSRGGGAAAGGDPLPRPARHPPSPWMPVWCAMAPCPAPPAPSEPSARPWLRSAGSDPEEEEEEDVAGAAQLALLPGRCRRTRPQQAPPPGRGREGAGTRAARAHRPPLVPGGRRARSRRACPRACVIQPPWAAGVRLRASVCACASLRAPGQPGLQAGRRPQVPPLVAGKGVRMWMGVRVFARIPGPETWPEPPAGTGHQPAASL